MEENKKPKILIVDDAPLNIKILSQGLRDQHEILAATTGESGYDVIKKNPDLCLIMLDIVLPDVDGYELCEELKLNKETRDIPVIFITSQASEEDEMKGFEIGAVDYIIKPFSIPVVKQRVANHIRLKKLNDNLQKEIEQKSNELLKTITVYEKFVPKNFLQFLEKKSITDIKLGNHVQKEMTVLFSDIRSFTTVSEELGPAETFKFLNTYLVNIGPYIRRQNGFVDKYIGDAIMALFPKGPKNAIEAGISMLKELKQLNKIRESQNKSKITIGIGIHHGPLMLGIIGEPQRLESTVISDAVNLTARLESLTKYFGTPILVSSNAMRQTTDANMHFSRAIGKVKVRGKNQFVNMIEILPENLNHVTDLKIETMSEFQVAMNHYTQQEFEHATKGFSKILSINPNDRTASLYYEHAKRFKVSGVPKNWEDSYGFDVVN